MAARRTSIGPSRWHNDARYIEQHIRPRLGGAASASIAAPHLNAVYADIRENGRVRGEGETIIAEQSGQLYALRLLVALTGLRRSEALGLRSTDVDLPRGRWWYPDHATHRIAELIADSGLPRIRPLQDLRHTHASLLLAAGEPLKVVQERLGHHSPAFTQSTYQHLLPGMGQAAARRFETLILEPDDGPTPS